MKIVELVLDLTDDQAGIEAISVVESPDRDWETNSTIFIL